MSEEGEEKGEEEEARGSTSNALKNINFKGTAGRFKGPKIPDELQQAVREIAQREGKSVEEAYAELLTSALAKKDEELGQQLMRRRIIENCSIDEAKLVFDRATDLFTAWLKSTQQAAAVAGAFVPVEQPGEGEPVEHRGRRGAWDAFDEFEEHVTGTPPQKTPQPPQSPNQPAMPQNAMSEGKQFLFGLAQFAVDQLLKNPKITDAIETLIREKGGEVMGDALGDLFGSFKRFKEDWDGGDHSL